MPRYRQKLAFPRLELGRPLWVDDPRFNIDYHVRRHGAARAGRRVEQLRLLAGRIFSQRLDRSKPLWEMWLVDGLEHGRFALINKTHHCLVDGVCGVDITDGAVRPRPTREAVDGAARAVEPAPEPSRRGARGPGRGRPRAHAVPPGPCPR